MSFTPSCHELQSRSIGAQHSKRRAEGIGTSSQTNNSRRARTPSSHSISFRVDERSYSTRARELNQLGRVGVLRVYISPTELGIVRKLRTTFRCELMGHHMGSVA